MKTHLFLAILAFAPLFLAQEAPSPDRGVQSAREMVRGDSGRWNDTAILQVIPPLSQKPKGISLDAWGDQLLETPSSPKAGEEVWLLFRTRQLDDNDRVWVEKIDRSGKEIVITLREAIWEGNYFKTFTYYGVLAVNLGALPAGDHSVKWVVEPLRFKRFDGDGRPMGRNGKAQNWPLDAVAGRGDATVTTVKIELK